jgi:hypothetical protein
MRTCEGLVGDEEVGHILTAQLLRGLAVRKSIGLQQWATRSGGAHAVGVPLRAAMQLGTPTATGRDSAAGATARLGKEVAHELVVVGHDLALQVHALLGAHDADEVAWDDAALQPQNDQQLPVML